LGSEERVNKALRESQPQLNRINGSTLEKSIQSWHPRDEYEAKNESVFLTSVHNASTKFQTAAASMV